MTDERIAPIIPLFGARTPASTPPAEPVEGGAEHVALHPAAGQARWRSTWDAEPDAPADAEDSDASAGQGSPPRLRALRTQSQPAPVGDDEAHARFAADAEELLVRKLRARSLSVAEARAVLKGFERDGHRLDHGQIDDVLDEFCRRGYLDDALLAGHLVTSGVERKGQGRTALSRALAQRGLPRDVIDAALDELPDDDAERALEYARSKARSLARLDEETALRRLLGQLARRGYGGSVAMNAAKTALREASFGRPGSASGVRFVDSE